MSKLAKLSPSKIGSRGRSPKPLPRETVEVPWLTPETAGITYSEELVATHEAGHLVAGLLFQLPLKREGASIVPFKHMKGHVKLERIAAMPIGELDDRSSLENLVVFFLAGRAAEEVHCGRSLDSYSLTLADGDLSDVREILPLLMPPNLPTWWYGIDQDLRKAYHSVLMARARSLVMSHWGAVQGLKRALVAHKTLSLVAAKRIFARSEMARKRLLQMGASKARQRAGNLVA
jgi:hypothetical protein